MAQYLGHDDHTVTVMADDGKQYRMARSHLLPETIEKLCGGGVAKAMSSGGSVKRYSSGGGVDWDNAKNEIAGLFGSPTPEPKKRDPQTSDEKKKTVSDYYNQSYAEGGEVEAAPQPDAEPGFFTKLGHVANNIIHGKDMYADNAEQPDPGAQQAPAQPPVATADTMSAQPVAPQGLVFNGQQQGPQQIQDPRTMNPATNPNLDMVRQGMDLQSQGMKQAFDQGQKNAAREVGFANAFQQNLQAQEAKHELERKDLYNQLDQKRAGVEKAYQDYSTSKVDPNRFWNNADTSTKVAGGLAILLGALAQGVNGGKNVGLQAVQQAIQADVDSQRDQIEKKKTGIGVQQNLYGDLFREIGDKDAAYNATMAKSFQNAELQLRAQAANNQQLQNSAQFQQALGEIQQKRGMFEQQALQQASQAIAIQKLSGSGSGQQSFNPALLPPEIQKRVVRTGNSSYTLAPDEKAADMANEKIADYDDAIKKLQEVKKLSSTKYGPSVSKSQAEAAARDAASAVAKLRGMRMNPENIDSIQGEMGDPNAFFQDRNKAKTDILLKGLQDRKEGILKQAIPNYQPLQTGEVLPEKRAGGGKVDGKAPVKGDSPKNDIVPAMLSPGEIVIPRTVVKQGPLAIMKFIKNLDVHGK